MWPDARRIGAPLALLLFASIAARAQDPSSPPSRTPAPVQPLPYSHKQHVALGLPCRLCHVNPDAGKLMTYPATAICMSCHATVAADRASIRKLASFAAESKPVPWVRVYQVPDYVYWAHGPHLAAKVTCVECHGPVAERDVISQETNVVTMLGCQTCHDKRQVFTACDSCHEPRQQAPFAAGQIATRDPLGRYTISDIE
jgi:hypothetical protein